MEDATKGWLEGWMDDLACSLQTITVGDYVLTAKAGKGPIVYVTLVGAEGDISSFRKIRPQIETLTQASIEKYVNDRRFGVSLTTGTKANDLVIAVEIVFPKA